MVRKRLSCNGYWMFSRWYKRKLEKLGAKFPGGVPEMLPLASKEWESNMSDEAKDLWKQRAKAFRLTTEFKALQLRYKRLHYLSPSRPRRRRRPQIPVSLDSPPNSDDDHYLTSEESDGEVSGGEGKGKGGGCRALNKKQKDPLDDEEVTKLLEKMFRQMDLEAGEPPVPRKVSVVIFETKENKEPSGDLPEIHLPTPPSAVVLEENPKDLDDAKVPEEEECAPQSFFSTQAPIWAPPPEKKVFSYAAAAKKAVPKA